MKLIHISDLHLGIRLYNYSLLEDQEFILKRMLEIIDDERPDGVIIAGDIYDKSIPSTEAVRIFDDFLCDLVKRSVQVYIISGNHDSPERMAFGSRLMDRSGVHIAGVYDGSIAPVTFEDEYGTVKLYLLPFVKPTHVKRFYPDKEIASYTDALSTVIDGMGIDERDRNVLVTHQFVTGSTRSGSEEITVGGTDNVDAGIFSCFDYVALGHLHSPQNCGTERIRYCGTPLKYSFSEVKDRKSVTVVDLKEKGDVDVRTVDLVPCHDMVELKGSYAEITLKSFYENTTWQEDYTHIILTDEDDIFDAIGKLRAIYHNLMKLDYDNTRTRTITVVGSVDDMERKTPVEMFAEFYEKQNGRVMSEEQTEFIEALMEEIEEEIR